MVSKNSQLILFIFLSIFLISLVTSQAPNPPQTNINIGIGLNIEFTKINVLENNQHRLFNAHVFNVSNQLRVDDITTECFFHLFDNQGEALIDQEPMVFDVVGLDWEFNVSKGNFTRNGAYSYLIVCSSSEIGGFISLPIEVTQTGNALDNPQSIIIIGLILILILLTCSFLYFGKEIEYVPFKIFLISIGSLLLMFTVGISLNIITELMILGAVFSATFVNLYRLMLILVSAGGIGLMLYIIYMAVKQFYSYRGLSNEFGD